jgi:hypothetical protein
VAKANPGLTGFNLDTEPAHSTAGDAALSVPFLKAVTVGINPIVTFEKQVLSMMKTLV